MNHTALYYNNKTQSYSNAIDRRKTQPLVLTKNIVELSLICHYHSNNMINNSHWLNYSGGIYSFHFGWRIRHDTAGALPKGYVVILNIFFFKKSYKGIYMINCIFNTWICSSNQININHRCVFHVIVISFILIFFHTKLWCNSPAKYFPMTIQNTRIF